MRLCYRSVHVCLAATVGLALWCADLNADALRLHTLALLDRGIGAG